MFLQAKDYKVVCDEAELDVLTQSDPDTRQRAERVAMEEVASYLRPRYDTEKAFTAMGDERNDMLVQVTANIALYYMAHWLPGQLAFDGRQELYDAAIAWLNKVSKGGAMPNLPTYTGAGGETDTSNPMRFGGMAANKYDY
ncbi:MAG: phage protein Gp36 family protein [Alistipes sp.]